MQINLKSTTWISVAFLSAAGIWNLPAWAGDKENENQNDNSQGNEQVDTIPPGAAGTLQRGVQNNKGPKSGQIKNLIDHGGPILPSSDVYFVWWGPSGFPSDAQAGMEAIASGMNRSSYLGIMNQYMRGATATTRFVASLFDTSAPPTRSPSTATIVNEVCKVLGSQNLSPDPSAVYAVITSNFPAHINYCAWHSKGTCNGVDIKVAYLPNATGVAGCDPGNELACNNYSEGTRSIADSYAHEFSEAITDPDLNAWYDNSGAEVADKCSFVYSSCVKVSNGKWQFQEEWSNAVSACVQQ